MTVTQAFPMIVWGNVGGVLIVYLAVIDLKILAMFMIGISGIAYGLGGKSRHRDMLGSMFAIGMLIFGVVLVKNSGIGSSDTPWIQWLIDVIDNRIWLALFLGVILKAMIQSGFVIALLEISLAQAGVINLAQVIAIFLGTRIATSLLSWILSAPYRSPGKQLMMIQVFYNLIGSVVFLILLCAEEYMGLPLVQRILSSISTDVSMQVASMALLYCGVTSVAVTLLQRPVLGVVDRLWPVSDDSEIGETHFITEQALQHPETAIKLAAKEQAGLIWYLVSHMAEFRKCMAAKDTQSECLHYHVSFQTVAKELNAFLIDLGNRSLSTKSFRRFLIIQERQGILTALESHVYQFASEEQYATAHPQVHGMAMRFMEALDFILLVAQSAFETHSSSDINVLKSLTDKRTTTRDELKKDFLSKHSQLDEAIQSRVLDMAILFEKTVWLIKLLAESLETEESSEATS